MSRHITVDRLYVWASVFLVVGLLCGAGISRDQFMVWPGLLAIAGAGLFAGWASRVQARR